MRSNRADADIATVFGADAVVAGNKVALHEVGHQILQPGAPDTMNKKDKSGHRGESATRRNDGTYVGGITKYYRADNKDSADWEPTVNIMSPDAHFVPMENGNAFIPGDPNATAGPIDRFYFYAGDVAYMRLQRYSPGRRR
ncbi:MAG: hypothetical protein HYS13_22425 [Planctomycetia bacterium]|nr:hypothetical protein [Planctomycetia bacterium]